MPAHSFGVVLAIAFALGVVSGMRSFLAIAATALTLWRRPEVVPAMGPASWLAHAAVAVVLALCALGELVADKMPWVGDRVALGPLVARIVTGAVSGAAAAQVAHVDGWKGGLVGAGGAVAGAFAFYHLRQWVDRVSGIRDPYVGAGEDVLALAIVATALANLLGA
jgi:uncharacterized membrane protein